jgi:1-phosphofructokinase
VLRSLIDASGVRLKAVECEAWSGAYIHDRRGGERCTVAETQSPRLTRHEADGLYGLTLAAGLEAEVVLLTGTSSRSLDADFFRRLATDLGENGVSVMADLSGDQLQAALAGGLQLVRVSEDQVVEDGYASSTEEAELVAGLGRICEAGARNAVVSRAGRPALARVEERLLELRPPRVEPLETRGAGDSQSAAIAAQLGSGATLEDALRFGTAAGALNVTRRGLGSGDRASIEELVQHVEVVERTMYRE